MFYRNFEKTDLTKSLPLYHLGYGVFETFLLKKINKEKVCVLGLHKHLERLRFGCEAIKLKYFEHSTFPDFLASCVKSENWTAYDSYRARIVIMEEDCYLNLEPFRQETASIALKSLAFQRSLPEVKSCSTVVSVLSDKTAKAHGYDEALLVDDSGNIKECSWSNFFSIDRQGKLITPKEGILFGVTREIVIKLAEQSGLEFQEKDVNLEEMADARACFTTRSTLGLTDVTRLDLYEYKESALVNDLRARYQNLYIQDNSLRTLFDI